MATVATKLMTAEEFYDFANRLENRDRILELEDGEVVEMSRPSEWHCLVCANLVWLLGTYIRKLRRGRVYCNDMGIILKRNLDTVRGPDIAVYMDKKKLSEISRKYPANVPLVVFEVLSPNDRIGKMMKLLTRFLARGVQVALLVDPESRNVTILRKKQEPIVLEDTEEIRGLPKLPGFRCGVAELFEVQGA